jgi:TatA/E family protein of Tat protein translocase
VPLLVLEFLGTTELLVILVIALILFGPRKLPELGRSLGKSLGEFKRASEDFKRTWEREVDLERIERDERIEREARAALSEVSEATPPVEERENMIRAREDEVTVARQTSPTSSPTSVSDPEPPRKRDWL